MATGKWLNRAIYECRTRLLLRAIDLLYRYSGRRTRGSAGEPPPSGPSEGAGTVREAPPFSWLASLTPTTDPAAPSWAASFLASARALPDRDHRRKRDDGREGRCGRFWQARSAVLR